MPNVVDAPDALDELVELGVLEGAAVRVAGVVWADRPGATLSSDLVRLCRVERVVGAAKLSLLGAFDASGRYRLEGHPSSATWMADRCRADRRRVRHQVGVARRMRSMPLTEDAHQRGLIGFEHVATLSRANTPDVAAEFAGAEADLVAAAQNLGFDEFCRAVRAWRDFVDPDGAEKRAEEQDQRREAHASRTFEGMVRIDAWLDAIGGTEFLAELHRLEETMFEGDWAEARARVGDGACASDLWRTAPQRRADAFVEMARRSATVDTPGRPPKWVLNVMMGYATFCAEAAAATGDPGPGADTDPGEDETDPDPEDEPDPDPDGGIDGLDDDAAGDARPHPGPPPPPPSTPPLPDWWGASDPFGPNYDRLRYDTMCELEDYTPIAPSQALSLGLAGEIRRNVFGPDGHIIDFGRAKPYYEGPLREAIIIRDRYCKDPGCGVPGRDCHIDHVIPRSRGGPTSERNGQCKCGTANRMKGTRMPERD